MRLAVLAPLLALVLAACGDIPQPFRHDEAVPKLARPKMTRGVTVRPIAGSPLGAAAADTLVRALEDQDVPALVQTGPAFGHAVTGRISETPRHYTIVWTLAAPGGADLASAVQVLPKAMLAQADPALMKRTAAAAAAALAQPLADPDGQPASLPAAADTRPSVTVPALRGLPGDGDKSLTEAIRRALGRGGLLVKDDGADYVVEGKVTVAPGLPGEDTVTIAWIVRRGAAGAELGRIAQDGAVPRGRLAQPWGGMARDIAEGSAAGVVEVVLADTGAKRRKLP